MCCWHGPVISALGIRRQEDPGVQSHLWLHRQSEASLDYIDPYLKTKMNEQNSVFF